MTKLTTKAASSRCRDQQCKTTADTAALKSAALPAAPGRIARDCFADIGAYGFADKQIAILAALITEDPLLLIGPSGTGKTYLLNSISETLGLEHRHYNASLIAFDDLVGFPYPDDARESVRFLQTPATIWGAESVLVDEISRCKPEHQNRLFSLVHERRIQGISLGSLRYRWAAMNPCTADQSGGEYLGSEPLDSALADRFAVLVDVTDWDQLSEVEQHQIGDPGGEGRISVDPGGLKSRIVGWRARFEAALENCPAPIINYACACANALIEGGVRISPRRVRLLARTLLAASIIEDAPTEGSFRTILECSIPHRCWGEAPDPAKVAAAHRLAWDATLLSGDAQWVHQFHLKRTLATKVRYLAETCPSPDTGTLAIEQLLANAPPEQVAAFALAVYPAAVSGRLPIGAEGVADLGKVAAALLDVDGQIRWQERSAGPHTTHPELTRLAAVLESLSPLPRKHRARQLFYWSLVNDVPLAQPARLESDFNRVVEYLAGRSARRMITHANIFSLSANAYHANTGGPRSRTQTVQLHSSVLGPTAGRFGCPAMVTVAIDFGRADPVAAAERLMQRHGIDDTEALRAQYQTIDQPCICRPVQDQHPPHIERGGVDEVLRRVLILGLSTGYVYDPARPVLLTHASLTRHLTLYAGEGFYA